MRYPSISPGAEKILKARYLDQGESIEGMFRRASLGNDDYYDLLRSLKFLPNSPTLFNVGLNNGCTLSACFVFSIQDTMFGHMDSIVNVRAKAIAVAKAGGGVGYYGGHLRPKNSLIKSVHRKACGPVAVLRDMHGVRALVTQGGKRDLAQMFVLPVWHQDIEEFIACKDDDPKALESFNISVGWDDEQARLAFEFMDSGAGVGAPWAKLWDMQCQSAWRTGCPGMWFPDTVNRDNLNLFLGLIEAPNPCGETPNRSNEPCSLGSQAICRYVDLKTRKFRRDEFMNDARRSLRYLDSVLDVNEFPHPDITAASLLTRKLGCGVMGWADFLALQGVHYTSKEAVDMIDDIAKERNAVLLEESVRLAKEKGPYPGFDADRSAGPWCRNETRSSIAPTGTIALLADVFGSVEPYFAHEAERTTNEGMKLEDGIPAWVKKELDGFVPEIANEIHYSHHVKAQAAWQRHTDLGVSKTINMPNSATVKDISAAYRLMWELKCKGGTIYRDGCRSEQVLRKIEKKSVYMADAPPVEEAGTVLTAELNLGPANIKFIPPAAVRKTMPDLRRSDTLKFRVAEVRGFLTVGLYPDGTPGELFLRFSKAGSTISGLLDNWAMMVSLGLQYGVPLESVIRLTTATNFEPHGLTGDKDVQTCTSILDFVVRWMEKKYLNGKAAKDSAIMSGQGCPECGTEMVRQANCLTCIKCGWNRCG